MNRSGLTRGTRWYQNSPSFSSSEVIHEKKKTFPKTTYFFLWLPLVLTSILLIANLRAQIDSGDPGLSFGYLTILLASIVIEIIAIFFENSSISRKFVFTLCELKFDLIKKWSKYLCRNCRGLSNAVYRLWLSFLVFGFSGGGVVIRPPPPAVRRWLRHPAVRELKHVSHARNVTFDYRDLLWPDLDLDPYLVLCLHSYGTFI